MIITRSVDETLLMTTCNVQGTTQSKVQTQRVEHGHVSLPIKHLEIRVTGKPGMHPKDAIGLACPQTVLSSRRHPAQPVSLLMLDSREIQALWSQT